MNRTPFSNLHGLVFQGLLCLTLSAAVGVAKAEQVNETTGDVSRGAVSWSQNCDRCHGMRNPTEFRDDLWRPIVAHMRVRAGLTGQQQRDILAFLQDANNPAPEPVHDRVAPQTAPGEVLSGKEIYDQTCIACHGPDGTGTLPGVPDFTAADSPLGKPDNVLLQHIMEGFQSPGSPMAMPAKGGNPNLNEADAREVLGFLRTSFGK